MSTFPQSSGAKSAQSLTGTAIETTYAATGSGTGVDVGAYPRCVASGALAVAGPITTLTVRLAVKYPGASGTVGILSAKPDNTVLAVEHTYTSGQDWALLTANHSGGVVFVEVKGDVQGGAGDTFTALVQGLTP